ncbi:lysylphosphatidylglycerol synthase transmembrane domain-containing protein [Chryseobacterium sp. A301]
MRAIRINKKLSTALKLLISLGLLFLVLKKIPLHDLLSLWTKIEYEYLFLGALLFLASQILSAKRLDYYFKAHGFSLSFRSNLELYFLGMFYNFFIPGGIGGDAYKVYLLNKKFQWNLKKLTFSVLNDRISGLVALLGLGIFITLLLFKTYWVFLLLLLIVGLIVYYYILKQFFPSFQSLFAKGLLFSLGIQTLQAISFILLLKCLGVTTNFLPYALLFLASSVLSLISFAGIGIREMLFLKASTYFHLDVTQSVSASLLFTVVTAFFALIGIVFQLRSLNLKTNSSL